MQCILSQYGRKLIPSNVFSRCGHLYRVASFSYHLPLVFLWQPPRITSPFFVASEKKRFSGDRLTIRNWRLKIYFVRNPLSNFYKPVKFGGVEFRGPLWAPYRLFPNIVTFLFVLVVPGLYGAIYKFRKTHTTTTLGW